MQHRASVQRGTQRAVQAVLEVELAVPLHDVREQVAVERRLLVEQGLEVEGALGRDEVREPDLARRDWAAQSAGMQPCSG